jgi:hypothetical protein
VYDVLPKIAEKLQTLDGIFEANTQANCDLGKSFSFPNTWESPK